MHLQAVNEFLIVDPIESPDVENKSDSGIIISVKPLTTIHKIGKVVSVGSDVRNVVQDQTIMYFKQSGIPVDDRFIALKQTEVIAVIGEQDSQLPLQLNEVEKPKSI